MRAPILLTLAVVFQATSVWAASSPPSNSASLLPGSNSKDPVSIEADKLVYFEKDLKAIYSGNVVVIQGDTKLTCSVMTIFMEKADDATPAAGAAAVPSAKTPDASAAGSAPATGASAPAGQNSRVRHMDCVGPVTVLSKTQTATGDSGIYDKPQNKVWLIGHVTLSDGGNVTKGDKLIYDLLTGQATVETAGTKGRVKGQFLPGGADTTAPAPVGTKPPN